jgi:glycosyltransferase involved in cell wall biosynthesis
MPGGGVETYLIKLAHFLQAQGMDVEIITTIEPGRVFADLVGLGIPAHHLDQPRGPFATPAAHARRVGAFLAAGGYDVVFVNNTPVAQAALAALPDTAVAIPVIHGDIPRCYEYYLANREAWNALVGVSPRVAAIAGRRAPGKPILCIPNGIELPTAAQLAARRPWEPALRLLFVGRLYRGDKGVHFLPGILQAYRRRGVPFHLRLIGEGPDEASLRRQFAEDGLDAHVTFLGWQTHEEVYEAYLDAHIALFPSTCEGFGLVPVEAAACGCVTVASRLPGVTDYTIADGDTGALVDVGDVEGFAAAIEAIYADSERWARMSAAGQRRAADTFSVAAMGHAYLRLIRDALDGRYPLAQSRRNLPTLDPALLSPEDGVPRALLPLYRRVRRTPLWRTLQQRLAGHTPLFSLPRRRERHPEEAPRVLFVAHDPDACAAAPGLTALMNGLSRAGVTVGFFHAQSATVAEEALDEGVLLHATLLTLRDDDEVERAGRHLAYVSLDYDIIVAAQQGATAALVQTARHEHAANLVLLKYVALHPGAGYDAILDLPLPAGPAGDNVPLGHLPPYVACEIARDCGDADALLAGYRRFAEGAPHHLVVLGEGPQEAALRAGGDRVHLLGRTAWRGALLRRAAAVIRLAPGLPSAEATAAGAPVVEAGDDLAAALTRAVATPRAAVVDEDAARIARYHTALVALLEAAP